MGITNALYHAVERRLQIQFTFFVFPLRLNGFALLTQASKGLYVQIPHVIVYECKEVT